MNPNAIFRQTVENYYVSSFNPFQSGVFVLSCHHTHTHTHHTPNTHTQTHTYIHIVKKVIAISAPPYYVIGASNEVETLAQTAD